MMTDTYRIELKNCAFFARHGVLEEEKILGQRFFVDVCMDVERSDALVTDTIENTVHYGLAFELIESVVTGTRRRLIEALALDIAKALTSRFAQIRHVSITVRKPSAPIQGILDYVQVTVNHSV